MLWRVLVTAAAWLVSLGLQFTDGQTFRNTIVLLVGAVVGCLPWIPLCVRGRGRRGWVGALIIVSLSALAIAVLATDLPRAYEFQKRFNQGLRGR
jgi:hypothetical protein